MNSSRARELSSVFFGTPEFALSSLEAAIKTTRVLGVVTQPDRPRGRGQKLSPCPVKELAQKHGLPCFSPQSLRKNSPELEELRTWMKKIGQPDFLLVTAYGNILPQEFLAWPKIGPINVHASLLPRWRGAAPIQRALEAGDGHTGVCLQKMVFELDAGDVLAEATLKIEPHFDAETLSALLSKAGGELLATFLQSFDGALLLGQPQNPGLVTTAKKIEKSEGFYSPDWTASEIQNRVRAFNVWPGVKAEFEGQIVKICAMSRAAPELGYPLKESLVGSLLEQNDRVLLVAYADIRTRELSFLEVTKIQFPGKPPQKATDVFRNYFLKKLPLALKKAAPT
jgi:methionyl-tRNA formyltransferase